MPQAVLEQWEAQIAILPVARRDSTRRRRIEAYLDSGHGSCWLRDDRIACLMEDALLHFDGERYQLVAWCIMPNHVHVVARIHEGVAVGDVIYSWKSWVAKQGNKVLGRTGPMWQREYHDRYMRDEAHLAEAVRYVEDNPVNAGLVKRAEHWRWSSARRRSEEPLT
jgi:putative DNA methylase